MKFVYKLVYINWIEVIILTPVIRFLSRNGVKV